MWKARSRGSGAGAGRSAAPGLRLRPGRNPLTTTFLDYLIPTAADVPAIEHGHIETPASPPGHFKGVGEGGAIGAPPAIANAVNDALAQVGAEVTKGPFAPARILEALERASARSMSGRRLGDTSHAKLSRLS